MTSGATAGPWWERHQVALYLLALACGAAVGLAAPGAADGLGVTITPLLAVLLYITFLQVPVSSFVTSAGQGRFLIVVLAVNFVIVPLVVTAMLPYLPDDGDIRLGMLLVLLCPCVDYVITFCGLAGGNSRRLLSATPLLLVVQMVMLPLYLRVFLGDRVGDLVDLRPFVTAFVTVIVLPLTLAWLTQITAGRYRAVGSFEQGIGHWMVPAMMAVLAVVVASNVPRVRDHVVDVAATIPFYLIFLVVMAPIGLLIGRLSGLDGPDGIAVAFSGATRNSLVVLPLALALPAQVPLAGAVVVTQTLVEVIGMVIYVRIIPRLSVIGRGSR